MINSTVAEPSEFNCKARRASRVQFPLLGSHVSKAIHYFIPRLVAIVRGI